MGLNSYKGGFKMGAGFTPSGSGYPLMEACDIQVDENGKRLDQKLAELSSGGSLPPEIETAAEMSAILESATTDSVGAIYKYTGPTTGVYEKGAFYIIEEEA